MRSRMFVVGVFAGVLLAASIVLASSLASASVGSGPPAYSTLMTESTTTILAGTSSTAVPAPISASQLAVSNATSTEASATTANSAASVMGTLSSRSSTASAELQPPSRLDAVLSQPTDSLLLLVPIVLALLLGFALRRVSAPGD